MKPDSGVKVTAPVVGSTSHSPSPGTVNVVTSEPSAGSMSLTLVGSMSPSGSVSLPNTSINTGWFNGPDPTSSTATGASFTGVTVMVSVALTSVVPSVMV